MDLDSNTPITIKDIRSEASPMPSGSSLPNAFGRIMGQKVAQTTA